MFDSHKAWLSSATAAASAAAVLFACAAIHAAAPPADAVAENYAAYSAALQRKDLAAAEVAAAAAYEASVQAQGDGGRTAVLALNLADVRLAQGRYDEAVAPARKALELAESQGPASGVDVVLARLLLDRAQLRSGDEAAAKRLEASLAAAAAQPDLNAALFTAAADLAKHSLENHRYDAARAAWATAGRVAKRNPATASPLLVDRMRVEESAAGLLALVAQPASSVASWRMPPDTSAYRDYLETLVAIVEKLGREAAQPGPTSAPTEAQTVFGLALAWYNAIKSKFRSEGRQWNDMPELPDTPDEIGGSRHALPRCDARVVAEPKPEYPRAERLEGGVGSVVLQLTFDEDGSVVRSAVAGGVGPRFVESVTAVAGRWRLARKNPDQAGCRMAREIFLVASFTYSG